MIESVSPPFNPQEGPEPVLYQHAEGDEIGYASRSSKIYTTDLVSPLIPVIIQKEIPNILVQTAQESFTENLRRGLNEFIEKLGKELKKK